MIESIISNNCHGAVIYHELGLQFKSPTISLQILPEDFWRFCTCLRHYLEAELREYTALSDEDKMHLEHMYGRVPTEWPIGRVDDVMIIFQHDRTFEEASEKWNRRKERVNYESIGYLFQVYNETYIDCAKKFLELDLPHSIVLTEGFDYPGACRFDIPEGKDGFGWANGKKYIEDNFSIAEWLEI